MPLPSPIALVLIGIASVQLGASVAKSLFDEISPTSLVWLRLLTSAVVLVAIARPRLRGRDRDAWLLVIGYAGSLALMNWSIYQSFARIPLGVAVTIEFIGPLSLAVLGSRRARDLVWVGLAVTGVVLLGAERADLDLVGVLYALLAGAMWAAYILFTGSVGRRIDGLDGLALASVGAALLMTPWALAGDGVATVLDSRLLLLCAVVGLLSSVVPYSCELVALRSLRPAVFGILMSLEPAAAALAGLLVLSESLGPLQWLAIGCVVAASIGASRQGRSRLAEPIPD